MSDDDLPTRFSLELPDFELAIAGDRAFVEELYRLISQDLLPILLAGGPPSGSGPVEVKGGPKASQGYTWVYGCTTYYNKVYAVDDVQLRASLLGPFIDLAKVRRIYVDRDESDLFSMLCGGPVTLWAEFTNQGRERFQS